MANLKGSQNPFPHVLIQEVATDGSDTGTPAADFRHLFLGEDGSLHLKDSAAAVTTVGASGAVATDAIWDAAGDLAVGTGANTAAKLAIGSTGDVLTVSAGTPAWAAPSSADPITAMFGAADTAYEFDTSSLTGLTAYGTPDAEDADTSVPGAYYIADNASGTAWCGRYIAIPSYPFTAVIKVMGWNGRANYNTVGLFLTDTTPKLSAVTLRAQTRGGSHELFTNLTTFASTTATGLITYPGVPCWLAITAASTTSVTSYISLDGYVWERIASAANPAMTIARVGFGMKSENAGGAAAAIDYFRVWNSAKTFLTGI